MWSVLGTAANGVGRLLGNAFLAPFRTLFVASCDGVCSGRWDVACFLEHLCISSLARLFMVLVLTYIMLFFVYLMCKIGIIQCVVKSACKMAAAACSACCHGLGATSCFLWRKLRDTKRVYRSRRHRLPRDIEGGESSTSSSDEEEGSSDREHDHERSVSSARRSRARGGSSVRERRKDRLRRSLRLRRLNSMKDQHTAMRSHGSGRHHHRVGLGRIEVPSPSRRVRSSARRR